MPKVKVIFKHSVVNDWNYDTSWRYGMQTIWYMMSYVYKFYVDTRKVYLTAD